MIGPKNLQVSGLRADDERRKKRSERKWIVAENIEPSQYSDCVGSDSSKIPPHDAHGAIGFASVTFHTGENGNSCKIPGTFRGESRGKSTTANMTKLVLIQSSADSITTVNVPEDLHKRQGTAKALRIQPLSYDTKLDQGFLKSLARLDNGITRSKGAQTQIAFTTGAEPGPWNGYHLSLLQNGLESVPTSSHRFR